MGVKSMLLDLVVNGSANVAYAAAHCVTVFKASFASSECLLSPILPDASL